MYAPDPDYADALRKAGAVKGVTVSEFSRRAIAAGWDPNVVAKLVEDPRVPGVVLVGKEALKIIGE